MKPGYVLVAALSSALAVEQLVDVRPPRELRLDPGRSREALVGIDIKDGFHVQANPAANEFLIPLTLKIEPTETLTAGEPRYPAPKRLRLKGASEDLLVYDGVIAVAVPIRSSPAVPAGSQKLRATVRYQACDDVSCRAPASASFELAVRISPKRRER